MAKLNGAEFAAWLKGEGLSVAKLSAPELREKMKEFEERGKGGKKERKVREERPYTLGLLVRVNGAEVLVSEKTNVRAHDRGDTATMLLAAYDVGDFEADGFPAGLDRRVIQIVTDFAKE